MPNLSKQNAAFVHKLLSLSQAENRAALAKLKRAAGAPYEDFEILPVIGDRIPNDVSEEKFKIYMLAACLYSLHPAHSEESGNLGETLRRFRATLGVGQESFDKRFAAVLNAETEDLANRLVQIFRQISRENVYVNYFRLLEDLLRWDNPNKYSQFNWARSYWAYQKEEEKQQSETE